MSLTLRMLFGLPVAILLPLSIGKVRSSRVATAAVASSYVLYVMYPAPVSTQLWVIGLLTPACALALRPVVDILEHQTGTPHAGTADPWRGRLLAASPLLAPLLLALVAATQLPVHPSTSTLAEAMKNDRLSLFISATLLAVFVGGLLVSYIVRPLAAALAATEPAGGQTSTRLLEAGTHIGWLERALFFVFFVGGAPEAAALALAAKAFVRAPRPTGGDARSEYYLVGSLASVSVALGVAVATRLALGRSAI